MLLAKRAQEFPAAPLVGRHVTLYAVGQEDYNFLYRMETSSAVASQWRLRGRTPSPQDWQQGLWHGVIAQYLVVPNVKLAARREPIGLVSAFDLNGADSHGHVAALKFDSRGPSPLLMMGFALFINKVFTCWDLRKLYMEVAEWNYAQFASGRSRYFDIEGRLKGHYFYGGQHWDQFILAIHKEKWEHESIPLIRAAEGE